MMRIATCVLILSLAFTAESLIGQTPSTSVSAANELFAQSKWPEAAAAYQSIVAAEPANAQVWQNLGEALLQQHKASQARNAFQPARDLHSQPVTSQVNI